jgi:hypothetical protein
MACKAAWLPASGGATANQCSRSGQQIGQLCSPPQSAAYSEPNTRFAGIASFWLGAQQLVMTARDDDGRDDDFDARRVGGHGTASYPLHVFGIFNAAGTSHQQPREIVLDSFCGTLPLLIKMQPAFIPRILLLQGAKRDMLKVAGIGWLATAAHHVYLAQVRLIHPGST